MKKWLLLAVLAAIVVTLWLAMLDHSPPRPVIQPPFVSARAEMVVCQWLPLGAMDMVVTPAACRESLERYLQGHSTHVVGLIPINRDGITTSILILLSEHYGPSANDLSVDEACNRLDGDCITHLMVSPRDIPTDVLAWLPVTDRNGLEGVLMLREGRHP